MKRYAKFSVMMNEYLLLINAWEDNGVIMACKDQRS